MAVSGPVPMPNRSVGRSGMPTRLNPVGKMVPNPQLRPMPTPAPTKSAPGGNLVPLPNRSVTPPVTRSPMPVVKPKPDLSSMTDKLAGASKGIKKFKNPLPEQASARAKQVRSALEAGVSPSKSKKNAAKARRQEQLVGHLKKNKGKVSQGQKKRFMAAAEKRASHFKTDAYN